MVHVDLIGGLSSTREIARRILSGKIQKQMESLPQKPALVRKAERNLRCITVLRYFLLDSMAYENIQAAAARRVQPDYHRSTSGGAMPKVIRIDCLLKCQRRLIIAGGLITDKESVMASPFSCRDRSFIYESRSLANVNQK